jgi:hypothetical protein
MKKMVRNIILAAVMLASIAMAGGQVFASIIYESATLGTTGLGGGWSLYDGQFLGSRFTLSSATTITSIAGHIDGNGTLFGAIVALSGPNALPEGSPFSTSEIMASGIFAITSPSSEQMLPLNVTLGPGSYGVIFGSGMFGATGSGAMPQSEIWDDTTQSSFVYTGSVDIGTPSYFFWGTFTQSDGSSFSNWIDGGFDRARFVVNGDASSVPEPTSLLLLGTGLGGLALAGWRRRK